MTDESPRIVPFVGAPDQKSFVHVTHHYDKSTGLQWIEKDGVIIHASVSPFDPNAEVAQSAERPPHEREVGGSIPSLGTTMAEELGRHLAYHEILTMVGQAMKPKPPVPWRRRLRLAYLALRGVDLREDWD